MKYKVAIVQLNLKQCLSEQSFYNYIENEVFKKLDQKIDLIVFPEYINACLLFSKKQQNFQKSSIRNTIEIIFDKLISLLDLSFIFRILNINNQKSIIISTFSQLAKKYNVYISTGSYAQILNNKYYSSFSLIDPNGNVLQECHKHKLLGIEKAIKIQTQNYPVCVETDMGNIGMCICYDMNEESYIKSIVDLGADFILCPSNGIRPFPNYPFDKVKERPQVEISKKYGVYIFRPYCAGWLFPFFYFQGHSHATDKNGNTLLEAKTQNKTEIMIAEISI
jgi:predicted amidohydrolase